jgi:hypothetical protein
MKTITYSIPQTLLKEKELLEAKCDLLIEAFNQLCKEEDNRLREEKKKTLENRIFKREIIDLENGWRIIQDTAINPVEKAEDNIKWSKKFKIINNVLFHDENAYKSMSWSYLNDLIPQGFFTEQQLKELESN